MISLTIVIHELGHYVAARQSGLIPESVNIGFGRVVCSAKDKHKTRWQVRLWPFGGFVDLCGNHKTRIKRFLKLPYLKKVWILLGGVLCNTICAVALFWSCNMLGYEYKKTTVGQVLTSTTASQIGLQRNDLIKKINGSTIYSWRDVAFVLLSAKTTNANLSIEVIRNQRPIQLQSTQPINLSLRDGSGLLRQFGILPLSEKWPAVISVVVPGSPAETAGLKTGDVLVSLNDTIVSHAQTALQFIKANPGQKISIAYSRQGKIYRTETTLGSEGFFAVSGVMGLELMPWKKDPSLYAQMQLSPLPGLVYAIQEAYQYLLIQLITFYLLFTGGLSTQTLGGPVIIISMTYSLFSFQHIISLIQWMGIINISLAFINLLPIPIFDGGRIFLLSLERIRSEPFSSETYAFIDKITLSLLLGLFAMITYQDIAKILGLTP